MVDRVDVSSVLMQMRQVKDQLRAQNDQAIKGAATPIPEMDAVSRIAQQAEQVVNQPQGDPAIPDFQSMFRNAIDNVNENQKVAADLATRFEQGDPSIDLPEVMIALQKSSVSFQAMTQVRNKLVEAYKDIMNMPV